MDKKDIKIEELKKEVEILKLKREKEIYSMPYKEPNNSGWILLGLGLLIGTAF